MKEVSYSLFEKVFNEETLTEQDIQETDINELDCYGIPVLHYAIHEHNSSLVQWLLEHKASPFLRNKWGFNAFQEAVSSRSKEMIEIIDNATFFERNEIYKTNVNDAEIALSEMKDFKLNLKYELQSWIPLASYLLPSDVNFSCKRGKCIRFDMKMIGFSNYSIKHGNCALIFYGEKFKQFNKGDVAYVDYDNKTYKIIRGIDVHNKIDIDKALSTNITTLETFVSCHCSPAYTMFGNTIHDNIEGEVCQKYTSTPSYIDLITRYVDGTKNDKMMFRTDIYSEEFRAKHPRYNPLLKPTEKEVKQRKTLISDVWIGQHGVQLDQFRLLMKIFIARFDDFNNFNKFFTKNDIDEDTGFIVKAKVPLALSLSAVVTIQNVLFETPDESLFIIPSNFKCISN